MIHNIHGNPDIGGDYRVDISGSKNAALPIISAALMFDRVILRNVPSILDVHILLDIVKKIGANVEYNEASLECYIDNQIKGEVVIPPIAGRLRGSLFLIGGLVNKSRRIILPGIGGCDLGDRKINFHIEGLQKMGVKFSTSSEGLVIENEKLNGTEYEFPNISVGATANLLMAASRADGKSTFKNVSMEPEIVNLIELLKNGGAEIEYENDRVITVKGIDDSPYGSCDIIPDRIEAGTYIALAGIKRSSIRMTGSNWDHLGAMVEVAECAGMEISQKGNEIVVDASKGLHPTHIVTSAYPGFPTDAHPLFCAMLCTIPGDSSITENIYEKRFAYTGELRKLGASIDIIGRKMIIDGRRKFSPSIIRSTDLRGGMATTLLASIAEGTSILYDNDIICRGYSNFTKKLRSCGVDIDGGYRDY